MAPLKKTYYLKDWYYDESQYKSPPYKNIYKNPTHPKAKGTTPTMSMSTDLYTIEQAPLDGKIVGNKAKNLTRMHKMGLTVPPALTFGVKWCARYTMYGFEVVENARGAFANAKGYLEQATGRVLGDEKNPLLVSVRSGASISMPGMMDTILNVGLNDKTVEGLAALTNEDFAWDSYRRFVQMYCTTVLGLDPEDFNHLHEAAMELCGEKFLPARFSNRLVKKFKKMAVTQGYTIPDDPVEQVQNCIRAVWKSWESDRAVAYRESEGIPHDLYTAVTIQAMVFGNLNDKSGTGVAFTRNPNTGHHERFGDFLIKAQGEDVVAGIASPQPLAEMKDWNPEIADELEKVMTSLEEEFGEMVDIEFTIEDGKLWILQARAGKRSAQADIFMVLEDFRDDKINFDDAVSRITELAAKMGGGSSTLSASGLNVYGTGLAACPGVGVGKVAFSAEQAIQMASEGNDVVLVTTETNPADVKGMAKSVAILTAKGGLVSHAALIARGWNKPCVVGCEALKIGTGTATLGTKQFKAGDTIKIDGNTGDIYL